MCYTVGMEREITQRELRNESGKIMREVDGGKSFIVTRNGVPVGELTPLHRKRFVTAEAVAALFRTAPPVDHERFRGDLDAAANQDATPRA
jgi:prevent-host-death family protein